MIAPQRTHIVFSLVAAVVLGVVASAFRRLLPGVPRRALVIASILVLSLYVRPAPFAGDMLEYSAAAETYLRVREEFPPLSWTLVAPVEQYQQVLGRGWHYELLRFAKEFNPDRASKRSFVFPIPTPHIFVIVEKIPLGTKTPFDPALAQHSLQGIEVEEDVDYYRNPSNRSIVEARAAAICDAYMSSHADASIYYEDSTIRVYHFQHAVKINSQ